MKCRDCGKPITWDNSYGKREYLICEDCFNKRIADADLATAYANLMAEGDLHAQALKDLESLMAQNKDVLMRLKER